MICPMKNCEREAKVNLVCYSYPADNGEGKVLTRRQGCSPIKAGEIKVCHYHALTIRKEIGAIRETFDKQTY